MPTCDLSVQGSRSLKIKGCFSQAERGELCSRADIGDLTSFHPIRTEAAKCILMQSAYRQADRGKGSPMSDTLPVIAPMQDPSGRVASGARHGGRLVRRTFLIALALVCGGLLTSGVVELVFRYRESVEGIGALQRGRAQRGALKI